MNLEWHISNRYLGAKKQSGTSLIAKVAISGLILAVMVLITVLSVMNGFHKELKGKVLNAISHGYVASYDNFIDYKKTQTKINLNPKVIASSPYIEKYGLINYGNLSTGISIRGVELKQEKKVSSILKDIKNFNTFKGENNIIIGIGIANKLHATTGDKVTIITPKISSTLFGTTTRLKRFVIADIFENGSEYDNNLAFIQLEQAQRLFNLKQEVDGIRLKLTDVLQADEIIDSVIDEIDQHKYYGVSWKEGQRNFITALKLEKQMIAIILSLIIAVAVFNIVSMMIMVVKDKKTDIAILRTFGFNKKQIIKTFFYLGVKIGTTGIIIGTILGLLLSTYVDQVISFVEYIFNIKFFPEDVFYISNFPSEIQAPDVAMIVIVSFILVILSSIYPAINASKINISQTLKEL